MTTHRIAPGSGLTGCCGRTLFELPREDQLVVDGEAYPGRPVPDCAPGPSDRDWTQGAFEARFGGPGLPALAGQPLTADMLVDVVDVVLAELVRRLR